MRPLFNTASLLPITDSVSRRFVITITYVAAGRGAECTTVAYDLLEWDFTQRACGAMWSQIKTSKQKPMLFGPANACHGEVCIFHVLVPLLRLLVDGGQRGTAGAGDVAEREYVGLS
jgi:hypothetical protein